SRAAPMFRIARWLVMAALLVLAAPLHASTLIVPDQRPTIQTALDDLPDTVLVRSGVAPEVPTIGFTVLRSHPDNVTAPILSGLLISLPEADESMSIEGFHIAGHARIQNGDESFGTVIFRDCVLDSGLTHQ